MCLEGGVLGVIWVSLESAGCELVVFGDVLGVCRVCFVCVLGVFRKRIGGVSGVCWGWFGFVSDVL